MVFGQKLVKVRNEKKMSQNCLEGKCGIRREYISNIENGRLLNPSLKTIRRIAEAFDIPISEFLEGVD